MKRTSKARSRFLRCITLLIALSFSIGQLYAQLSVSTVVPTGDNEALNVGVGTANFSTTITNTSNNLIHISSLLVIQPIGVSLVSATTSIGTATVNGNSIDLNTDLPAGQTLTVNYLKKASCEIVPDVTSNFTVHISDNIVISSTTGTYSATTNSYPIVFPGLKVGTPVSPKNNKPVEWQVPFSDTIPVANASSAGKVGSLVFTMRWATPAAIQIMSMSVLGSNGTAISVSPVLQGDSASISLDSTLLVAMGFTSGILNPGDAFKVILTAKPLIYFADLKTIFSVDYHANGATCKRLVNATGIEYYNQLYPAPNMVFTKNTTQLGNWCGTKDFKADYTVSNLTATGNSNLLFDSYITFATNCTNLIVKINGTTIQSIGDRYYIPTGKNLDGNATISDIGINDTYTISVTATPPDLNGSAFSQTFLWATVNATRLDNANIDSTIYAIDYSSNPKSFVTGPATLDDKKKPTGVFTFTYSAVVWQGKGDMQSGILDYDLYVQAPGQALVPATHNWDGTVAGSDSLSVTACTGVPLTFALVAQTAQCPDKLSIITSATPTTVQRCHAPSSGCYGLSVDTAYFTTPKQINTCGTATIFAKGEFDYICNSSCPKWKTMVVNVTDVTNTLHFTVANPQLTIKGVAASLLGTYNYMSGGKAQGVSYEFAFKPECGIPDSSFSAALEFNGVINIPPDHSFPDRTDANIQVKYIAIDNANGVHDDSWSWGDMLTVFDPEIKFDPFISDNVCDALSLDVSVSEAAPGTSNGALLKSIAYPAIPDFYYGDLGASAVNRSETKTMNDVLLSNSRKNYSQYYSPECASDGAAIKPDMVVQYTDFYNTSCQVDVNKAVNVRNNVSKTMPNIVFHQTEKQQSLATTTTWHLQIENNGSDVASNVMVKIAPDKANAIRIRILQLALDGSTLAPSQYTRVNDTTLFVNVGSLSVSQQKDLAVTARYSSCTNSGISTLNVQGACSCEAIDTGNFHYFACPDINTQLQLENMAAVLNAVEQYPSLATLCSDSVLVNINNTGRADLDSLGFWFESLPPNTTLSGNKLNWSFNNTVGTLVNLSTKPPVNLFQENKIISENVLSNNNPGAALHGTDPTIQLGFNVEMHCNGKSEIPLDTITFHTRGFTNCGDEQKKDFNYLPNLKGFEHLKDLEVTATGGTFTTYKGNSQLTVQVKNTSAVMVDSAYITVDLPTGVKFVSYTAASGTNVHSVDTATIGANGIQKVQFELTKGQHMQPGETVSITMSVVDKENCPPDSSVADIMGTLKRKMTDCDNGTCLVEASTKADTLHLKRPPLPFDPKITGPTEFCINKQTQGNYSVSGDNIKSVTWSVTPQAQNIIAPIPGLTATIRYSKSGQYLITAQVTSICPDKQKSLSISTQVDTVPVVKITPVDTIQYSDWKSRGVTLLSATPSGGVWRLVSAPSDKKCGSYTYSYTVTNNCGSDSAKITFEVNHCCGISYNIVSSPDEMPNFYDIEMLREYIAVASGKAKDEAILYQNSDGTYTIQSIDDWCGWLINYRPCFPGSADYNGDGKIDEKDVQILIDFVAHE